MLGDQRKRAHAPSASMRPPPITRQRCLDQARAARDAAAAAATPSERKYLLRVATAYDELGTRAT